MSGDIRGVQVSTNDKYNPDDTVPLTPLQTPFATDYGNDWDEITLQGILEYEVSDNILTYLTVGEGFKSGGFQDTPANAFAARLPYDPETATNYEVGLKSEYLDNQLRVNVSLFTMDYKALQVSYTSDECLCNVIANAADAKIEGIETRSCMPLPRRCCCRSPAHRSIRSMRISSSPMPARRE